MLARLNALESDNAVVEPQLLDDDDDEASLNMRIKEDLYGSVPFVSSDYNYKLFCLFTSVHFILIPVFHKKYPKGTKRKTRQAKALENKRAPKSFFELLNEANLESLPPQVPTYLKAAVGPPSSSSHCHFCTVCGFSANYTCVQCGMRFCSIKCQTIHNDTRCLKFVA
ncbi:SWR1 complex subunit 6 [Capsicum baccatum]|uniref:SWR1 complex subunit 6 n=1 Tax=Capsicum baccatum TaxID=33114 RepID=A0A2G2WXD7_CAPBA|nr:SWR1 complex subunit 6 [Capsicum baccatum]